MKKSTRLRIRTTQRSRNKLSALTSQIPGDEANICSRDIRERISKWTEGLQMSELQKFRMNFRLGSSMIRSIEDLRRILQEELNKQTGHQGKLHEIGSYPEVIKLARDFDFDFLYVIHDKDVEVRADEQQGLYKVFKGGVEIKPRQLNSTLGDCMDKIMSQISLPWRLEHGGHAGPDYSGIRFNGPAVTLQFLKKGGGNNRRVIPLDITPVFPLPNTSQESEGVKEKIKQISQNNRMPHLIKSGIQKLYVVSQPLANLWQPTTAYVESCIIRNLDPFRSPVKGALQLTKSLLYYQKTQRQQHTPCVTSSDESTSVIVALERYAQITDNGERDAYRQEHNTKMRYQHIYLPSEAQFDFCETSKSTMSVNNAAIKHVILARAAEIWGSYSGGYDNERTMHKLKNDTVELIRAAYRELANTNSFSVNHAFLPLKISKFTFHPNALQEATHLRQTVQDECAAILDIFLKDDQVNHAACGNL